MTGYLPSGTMEADTGCEQRTRSVTGSSACCMASLGMRRESSTLSLSNKKIIYRISLITFGGLAALHAQPK